jgi:cell division septum initiation protein DivIVA
VNKEALKGAQAVLARVVMQPRMDAIAELAAATEAAADPERTRRIARQRADELAERARQQGQKVLEEARQKARDLTAEAARQGRELKAQAEVDIQAGHRRVHVAYRDALKVGWTEGDLKEAGWPPPESRPPRRPSRHRKRVDAGAASGSSAATGDTERAEPVETSENVPS